MDSAVSFRPRAFGPRDIHAVLAIQKVSPEAAQWSAADYAHVDRSTTQAWVAENPETQGDIVAFLVAQQAADQMEILNLAVRPDHRRRGAATQLLKLTIDRARLAGAAELFLEVRESNRAAIAFYQGFNFNAAGYRASYYKNPEESALILTLAL